MLTARLAPKFTIQDLTPFLRPHFCDRAEPEPPSLNQLVLAVVGFAVAAEGGGLRPFLADIFVQVDAIRKRPPYGGNARCCALSKEPRIGDWR